MGKGKKQASSSNNKGSSARPNNKCTCADPYKCSCGNRPERPSRGHKWDPEKQEWGGKGHKQKGAGTVAESQQQQQSKGGGGITLTQHQKLPTQMLKDYCKRLKRPPPVYMDNNRSCGMKLVLKDAKDPNKDLMFVPQFVNEEKEEDKSDDVRREECAILGLIGLDLYSIPFEKQFPEPYSSLWIAASAYYINSSNAPTTNKSSSINKAVISKQRIPILKNELLHNSKQKQEMHRLQKATKKNVRESKDFARQMKLDERRIPIFLGSGIIKEVESLVQTRDILTAAIKNESKVDFSDDDNNTNNSSNLSRNQLAKKLQQKLVERGFDSNISEIVVHYIISNCDANNLNQDAENELYQKCIKFLVLHLSDEELEAAGLSTSHKLEVVKSSSNKQNGQKSKQSLASLYELFNDNLLLINDNISEFSGRPNSEIDEEIEALSAMYPQLLVDDKDLLIQADLKLVLVKIPMTDLGDKFPKLEVNIHILKNDTFGVVYFVSMNEPEGNGIDSSGDKNTLVTTSLLRESLTGYHENSQKLLMDIISHFRAPPQAQILLQYINLSIKCRLLRNDLEDGSCCETESLFDVANVFAQYLMDLDGFSSMAKKNIRAINRALNDSDKNSVLFDDSGKNYEGKEEMKVERQGKSYNIRVLKKRHPFFDIKFKVGSSVDISTSKKLPIDNYQQRIEKMIEDNKVLLVEGQTGCGKSTRTPLFFLGGSNKVVVTQPRRLAVLGLHDRIKSQNFRNVNVGYSMRGESSFDEGTNLLFVTTGILLRYLTTFDEKLGGPLSGVTHVVLDEIHERSIEMDILLSMLSTLMFRGKFKVVLMSATMDVKPFINYFHRISKATVPSFSTQNLTAHVSVPGRTFPVTQYWLEDAWREFEYTKKCLDHEKSLLKKSESAVKTSLTIDYTLISRITRSILQKEGTSTCILIFLPGVYEITKCIQYLERIEQDIKILPLHSKLPPEQQRPIFRRYDIPKIIVSTNIAETSVTIEDIRFVIDACLTREMENINRVPTLVTKRAPQSSILQRKGRAGRVSEGVCYSLVTKPEFDSLPKEPMPEILRVPFDNMLLVLLKMNTSHSLNVVELLNRLLVRPDDQSILSTIEYLKKLGTVSTSMTGTHDCELDISLSLTSLGIHCASMPLPPALAKLLILSSLLKSADAVTPIVAALSLGYLNQNGGVWKNIDSDIFYLKKALGTDDAKNSGYLIQAGGNDDEGDDGSADLTLTREKERVQNKVQLEKLHEVLSNRERVKKVVGNSDLAKFAKCYIDFMSASTPDSDWKSKRAMADAYGLSMQKMNEVHQLASQLKSTLKELGFSTRTDNNSSDNVNWKIVRACIVAAFSPCQLVKVKKPSMKYQDTMGGTVLKAGDPKDLKYFIHSIGLKEETGAKNNLSKPEQRLGWVDEQRVFMHQSLTPSSAAVNSKSTVSWLVYSDLISIKDRTYLTSVTDCSSISLLLFGGDLKVEVSSSVEEEEQMMKSVIYIDGWVQFSASARVGALFGVLREKVDQILLRKFENQGSSSIVGSNDGNNLHSDDDDDGDDEIVMRLIYKLINTDGMG